ncbi:citrate synthase 2 [Agilicoccus flavus]|uniref:citrate synthase 2 n=1 Tax=Agilicoccus flavus TaxID=2775968 RepID=UPI001CF6F6D3|nr:citrate synthase 2 [Agilicoccus flavus]
MPSPPTVDRLGSGPYEAAPRAFSTRIAEADPASDTLRYRGVALRDLVGTVPYAQVWGLLVDDSFATQLPPAEMFPLPVRTGDIRVDVQSALAQLAPVWGFRPLHDVSVPEARDQLARASVLALSFVAQSARGPDLPIVPQRVVDRSDSIVERFLIRWRGEADPRHAEAIETYMIAAAEHGFGPSTLTARMVASTGADVAACLSAAVGASSGPLHGGAPARALSLLEAAERDGDPDRCVARVLDSGYRLMGFGHRIYRRADPRAEVVRETCRRLEAPRYELALRVEAAARAALAQRHPDKPVPTNLEFWGAVLLDAARVPASMYSAVFTCARVAGWSAHILEQKAAAHVVRGLARYEGAGPRGLLDVVGGREMMGV